MTTPPESPKRKNDETQYRLLPLTIVLIVVSAIGLLWISRSSPQNDLPTARLMYPEFNRFISLNLQTGEQAELPFSEYHRQKLSPNGEWRAYWSDFNLCCDSQLTLDSTDQNIQDKSLGVFYGSSDTISWMPDSQWIAFSATPQVEDYYNQQVIYITGIPEEIYLGNVTTLEIKRLTENGFTDRFPAISPDGTQIAYSSNADGVDRVYIMDIATRESRILTPDRYGIKPIWSPDGQWIAFISNTICQPTSSSESLCEGGDLWIIRADGTDAQSVMLDTGPVEPIWLP